ncbi:MAG: hypothetical protein OXH98_21350 [Caldilineaceae bacterium]|nr:hypothetical protein [Caldilineaceae bacterium]
MGQASGKTALIAGASSGTGRACALRLDRACWRVFVAFRRWIQHLPTPLRDRLIFSQMPEYCPSTTFAARNSRQVKPD